ncbi:MAG: FAD-dependent oxidoreductase [Oscillospiraceae bacterium]|nr:FAD-dependent oxidoreductase [Oscillospiraceae bacterium]
MNFELLFTPYKIGSVELKNRIVMAPMDTSYCDETAEVSDRQAAYFEERAKGGAGLILTEYTSVDETAKGTSHQQGIFSDHLIPGHKKMVDAVHKHGAKIFCQLHHAGSASFVAPVEGRQTVSSSAVHFASPFVPTAPTVAEPVPHALTTEEVKAIIGKYIDAAERAKKAGYDGVELHGSNGYFLEQFLSSYINKRTDEYGGTLQGRAQIVIDIITGIKERCGKDFAVQVRYAADDFAPGGTCLADARVFAMLFEDAGADALNLATGGQYTLSGLRGDDKPCMTREGSHLKYADLFEEVRRVVSIPVYSFNRCNDPYLAESILKAGKADLILMGRAFLADPYWPTKAKEGRCEDIRRCLGCMQGCVNSVYYGRVTTCVLNPTCGYERERALKPLTEKKKVFIAGGGCGGMEAAIVAAKRGHDVELFESTDTLGGQFLRAGVPPFKQEINAFIGWQRIQLNKLGVTVHMNTPLTAETVEAGKPDAVFVATGAKPFIPPIKGADKPHVLTAYDVLSGAQVGVNAVVIGGGETGVEVAEYMVTRYRAATIVEMLPKLGKRIKQDLIPKIKAYVGTKVLEILDDGVKVLADGEEKIIPCDTVIMAVGVRPVNTLSAELEGKVDKLVVIGDAKEVHTVEEAVRDGYDAGNNL